MKKFKLVITILCIGWIGYIMYVLSTLFVTLNLLWLSLVLLFYSIIVYAMGRHDIIFIIKSKLKLWLTKVHPHQEV